MFTILLRNLQVEVPENLQKIVKRLRTGCPLAAQAHHGESVRWRTGCLRSALSEPKFSKILKGFGTPRTTNV